jgi:hypothetical protein
MSDPLEIFESIVDQELVRREQQKAPVLERPIVPWEEWIASEYYSGPFSTILFPFWKAEIRDFLNSNHNEWVVTGCIGGGKTTAVECLITRKLYELSCWNHPQRLFGLSDVSKIVFAYLSVSQKQAALAGFSELRDYLDATQYFREVFPRRQDVSTTIEFPQKKIIVISGSSSGQGQDVLSLHLFGAFLDEANYYKSSGGGQPGDLKVAHDVYNKTTYRRRSRYLTHGTDYSFSALVSSAEHDLSFTETRIKQARELGEKQKVTLVRPWLAKPAGTYSSETFLVFTGSDKTEPAILDKTYDFIDAFAGYTEYTSLVMDLVSRPGATPQSVFDGLPLELQHYVLAVPIDFHTDFKKDLYTALKDIAGHSVAPASKFFQSTPLWMRSCQAVPELRHPFTKDILQITTNTTPTLLDYFIPDVLFDPVTKMFRRHPHAKRFVHIDQSTKIDPTGVGMVHIADWVDTPMLPGFLQPIVEVDFVLRITNTKHPDSIALGKIVSFFLHLEQEYQVKYGRISYDKAASDFQIQLLESQHIPAGRTSVDADDKAWLDTANLLEEGRLWQYYYDPLKQEFFKLVHDRVKHKVDHPTQSYKDVSDGLVGAINDCLLNSKGGAISGMDRVQSTSVLSPGAREVERPMAEADWLLVGYERKFGKVRTVVDDKDSPRRR